MTSSSRRSTSAVLLVCLVLIVAALTTADAVRVGRLSSRSLQPAERSDDSSSVPPSPPPPSSEGQADVGEDGALPPPPPPPSSDDGAEGAQPVARSRPMLFSLSSKIQAQSSAAAHSYPSGNPGTLPGGLTAARAQIRGTPAVPIPDPVFVAPGLGPQIGGITYVLDSQGRVSRAFGPVVLATIDRPGNSKQVQDYCDVLYEPLGAPSFSGRDKAKPSGRATWQSGHVLAFALGGSSADPLNFYPQYYLSNIQIGRWGRIERAALEVTRAVLAVVVSIVEVDIYFTSFYGKFPNNLTPATGVYIVKASFAAYKAIGCVQGAGGVPGLGSTTAHGATAYVQTFCRWAECNTGGYVPAVPAVGPALAAGQCWLRTDFSNSADDEVRRPSTKKAGTKTAENATTLPARASDANLFP